MNDFEKRANGIKSDNGSGYNAYGVDNAFTRRASEIDRRKQDQRTKWVQEISDTSTRQGTWNKKYNDLVNSIAQKEKERNGGFTRDASYGFSKDIDLLIDEYDSMSTENGWNAFYPLRSRADMLRGLRNQISDTNYYFSQFADENDYNWFKKYQGQDSDSLLRTYDSMEDGDEKNWLEGYMDQVYASELPSVDIEASRKKVTRMENALDVLRKNTRFVTDEQGQRMVEHIRQQYGDEDAIERAINRENQRIRLATRAQEIEANRGRLEGVTKNADFAEKSKFDPTNTEIGYRYVNGSAGDRLDLDRKYGQYAEQFGYYAFDSLTDEQKAIYNYHMNTGDRQAAADYLKNTRESLNYQKGKQYADDLEGNTALELLYGVEAGLDQFRGGIEGLGAMVRGDDGYVAPSYKQVASSFIREDMANLGPKLPKILGGSSIGQVAYDTVTTSANMVPSILTSTAIGLLNPAVGSAAGAAMLGASAGGSAYQEMINSGYSVNQARVYGTAIGTAEAAMEQLLGGIGKLGSKTGLGNRLVKWAGNVDNALLAGILRVTSAGFSEGLEESIQEVVDVWLKNEITHENFELKSADVLYSGLLGAITGFAFEGPESVSEVGNISRQGRSVLASNGVGTLKEMGRASENADVQALAKRVDENTGAYTIGRLLNQVGADVTEKNIVDITNSLMEKGIPGDIARKNAEVIANIIEGGSATELQRVSLDANPIVSKVMQEMMTNGSFVHDRVKNLWSATGRARTIDQVSAQYGKQAQAVKLNYIEGQDVDQYDLGFKTAFEIGRGGKREALTEKNVPYLTESQREIAFGIGQSAAAMEKAAANKRVDGTQTSVNALNEDGSVGDAVQITAATSTNGDGWTYKTADGKEIHEDQLSFSGDHAVLETVKSLGMDLDTANIMIGGNNTIAQPDAIVAEGIEDAVRYGRYGYSIERLSKDSEAANVLTDEMRAAAYNFGKKARQTFRSNRSASRKAAGKTGVYFDAGNGNVTAFDPKNAATLTGKRKAGVEAAMVLQKLGIGGDYYFYESYEKDGKRFYLDKNGMERKAPNGWYDPSDGSIHIDLNAGKDGQGTTLFTLSHELTHFIEQWSKEKYGVLADFLIQNYEKGRSVDELVRIKQLELSASRGEDISYEEAYSEGIADSMEKMLSDGNVMQKLVELKAKDNSLFAKMKQFFDNLAKKIRSLYDGLSPDSREGNLAAEMKDQIERIQQLFAEALADASENYRSAVAQDGLNSDGDVQLSDREESNAISLVNQLKNNVSEIRKAGIVAEITGDEIRKDIRPTDAAMEYVKSFGGVVTRPGFGDVRFSKTKLKSGLVGHGFGNVKIDMFAAVPDVIRNGVEIGSEKNWKGRGKDSFVFAAPIKYKGNVALIGVIVERDPASNMYYVHEAVDENGNVFAFETKKEELTSDRLLAKDGSLDTVASSSDSRVPQNNDAVKYSDRDSNSRTLTKEQQNFFKDSEVRDEDGNLRVVYHGTDAEFTVFDRSKLGSGTDGNASSMAMAATAHIGFWFNSADITKNPDAAFLDRSMEGYLNIRNPLYCENLSELEDLILSHNDGVVSEYDLEWGEQSEFAGIIADKFRFWMEENGYDGIIVNEDEELGGISYVALHENQFKNVNNQTPTDDPDIRYSDRTSDSMTNRELLANALESTAQNELEFKKIQEYKEKIGYLNEQEAKLQDLRTEIRELSFGTGKRDTARLKELQTEAVKTANRINIYDKQLIRLESTKALQAVLDREKKKAYDRGKARSKKVLEGYRERRDKTDMRKKIRKDIRELTKILEHGDKKRNVKDGMRDFVSTAIASAEVLFTDNYSNEDMVLNGVGVEVDANENRLLDETYSLLQKRKDLYSEAAVSSEPEYTISGDLNSYNKRMEQSSSLDRKISENMRKLSSVFERERNRMNRATVSELLHNLAESYRKLGESENQYIRTAIDENVYQYLVSLSDSIQGTLIRDMNLRQMEDIHKAYTAVMATIRNANKGFASGRSVQADAEQMVRELEKRKTPKKEVAIIAKNLSDSFGWNYEKLYYALHRINSPTLTRLFGNLADSENISMRDVEEAKAFQMEMVEKYHYNDWKVDQKIDRTFVDNTGKEFQITLGEMMSLYAYAKRENADKHIEFGGFTFDKASLTDPKPANTYKLTLEQCEKITGLLTDDQKSFATEMQKYLSEVMGEKGNEVTMQLYGIKMFTEAFYFPLHIAGEYKANAQESQAKAREGFQAMSNAGFTKARTPNAKAPIVLEGFMDVWVDHINEMSRYHGAVPALEDIRRVMNYSVYSDSESSSVSVKAAMVNAYGKKAMEYFDSLYREANSGAISDKMDAVSKKLLSKFRKNAVAYSLSVVIQQPASIFRARAIIDRKYFGKHGFFTLTGGVLRTLNQKKWNAAYNEMLKYAPGVTMAKEIGGFDTGTGGSIRSYLMDTDRGFLQSMKNGTAKDRAGAVLKLVDDNWIANLPNVADKIAWIEMWEACKRETVAKNHSLSTSSEAFFQNVGERFTEVIRATQVYDSMFAKSPMLRSKSMMAQMATSFMNEPNTVANMAEAAIRDITRGNWQQGVKTAVSLMTSIAMTNVLKSIVYAMRDDDEDEMFIEKYISAIAGNLIDDVTIFNYIPYARDIWSVIQGYDVERADMSVISDAVNAVRRLHDLTRTDITDMDEDQLAELEEKTNKAMWRVAETLSPLVNVPLKNVRRDILAIINTVNIAKLDKARQYSDMSIRRAVEDAVWSGRTKKTDKLYSAITEGDTAYADRLRATYKTEETYHTAIKSALRDNDTRITEAAQKYFEDNFKEYDRILTEVVNEKKFDFDDIHGAIMQVVTKLEKKANGDAEQPKEEKPETRFTAENYYRALRKGDKESADLIYQELYQTEIDSGYLRHEAKSNVQSSLATQIKNAYMDDAISRADALKMLKAYTEKDETEVKKWDFEIDTEYAWGSRARGYYLGDISRSELMRYVMDIDGTSQEDAQAYVDFLDLAKGNEDIEITSAHASSYFEYAEPVGIGVDMWIDFKKKTSGIENDKDGNGNSVPNTAVKKIMEIIDSFPVSDSQKYAMAKSRGWKDSTIRKFKRW